MSREGWSFSVIQEGGCKPSAYVTEENIRIIHASSEYSASIVNRRVEIKNGAEHIDVKIRCYAESDGAEYKFLPVFVQYDKEGNQLCGEYFAIEGEYAGLKLELQKTSEYAVIEIVFLSFGKSELNVAEPEVSFPKVDTQRIVRVATAYFERKYCTDCGENLKEIVSIIKRAANDKEKPDIICFTETAYDRGTIGTADSKWIPVDSLPVDTVCEAAKESGINVVFGIHEVEGEKKYNTALVISDRGEIIGKYRKVQLTYNEIKGGCIPGKELPVFSLPFGKIGIMICWDQWFPDVCFNLKQRGAEIIFVPTAGDPRNIYCSRAYENGVYIVVSGCKDDTPGASCIIDQYGEIIAEVEDIEKGYTTTTLNLDEHKYQKYLCFEYGSGVNMYSAEKRTVFNKEEKQ